MNESAGGLSAALVAALGELGPVPRSGVMKVQGRPDRSYSTLTDLHSVLRPAFAKHGLCWMQPVVSDGDWVHVFTLTIHASGEEKMCGPFSFPAGRDAQATGSSLTYYRRYALGSTYGLAPDDDDDGGAASAKMVEPAVTHPRRPVAPPGGAPSPSGVPSGSAQLRAARAAVSRAEEWRARVRALPAGDVRSAAAKVFTDGGAVPGEELSPEQAVVILGKLKRHEPRIVLEEASEPFDDGPPLDDEDSVG